MTDYHLPPCPQSDLTPITTTLSDFRVIRKNKFLLVDKTSRINTLLRASKVFLARPRRFGKTLLLSTIKELFTNGAKNFEGLAIHDLWDRPCLPVIKVSFFGLSSPETFEQELCARLREAFAQAGFADALQIKASSFVDLVPELNFLYRNSDIVLLIDEWDFPLSANLNDRKAFDHNKDILRRFYSWVRELQNLEFLMVTGIGRYQDTSLFTGQDIKDISLDPRFANLLGYTQEELESYFSSHISAAAALLNLKEEQLLELLKRQYDGFCFDYDAKISVYCPISINNFFLQVVDFPDRVPVFGSYWMESSNTAPALRAFLDRKKPSLAFLDSVKGSGIELSQSDLSNAYSFDELNFNALLTQTGYLSIKQVLRNSPVSIDRIYSCSFPNQEIERIYGPIFLRYITQSGHHDLDGTWSRQAAQKLSQALYEQDIARVVAELNVFMCAIPYDLWADAKEIAYRTFIGWCLQFSIVSDIRYETMNNRGRSDLEFTVNDCTYVIELKRLTTKQNTLQDKIKLADVAQQQVYDKGYGFNSHVNGDTQRYGLVLVVSEHSRQIEYWRYFDGSKVISEGEVAPLSMANPLN
ncbi:MAG TPA: ATP-binding protein [Candidatus Anaerobiospirillum pullistercoris]|uniref:ATP-binding protein n=1 Tax=Candidatus Anaerobiospirillum pullistercoris TaxID=2838452 RepID=A0A9D1WE37_9GAMM|nr:ATP-binding protein [Candidatus Anaerobiospirillum pullistercoris]